MDKHKSRGIADKTVSIFLENCLQRGMVDEILKKRGYTTHEIDQVKQGIQEIADEHALAADLHRSMLPPTTL